MGKTGFVRIALAGVLLHWTTAALGAPRELQLTIDGLNELLANPAVSSVEAFLAKLPEDFRANNIFIYDSQSTQYADPMNPRVILFRPDGRLALTFVSERAPDSQRIEFIQFNDTKRSFEFFETTLQPGRPSVIEPKQDCTRCHRADPRPNWQAYFHWAGVYGSDDGRMPPEEASNFSRFVAQAQASPRYRQLPIRDHEQINNNQNLTEAFGALNFKRVARLLEATPEFPRFKYAYAVSMMCGSAFQSALPDDLRPPGGVSFMAFDAFTRDGSLNPFRFTLELQGIHYADWSMTFKTSNSTFDHLFTTPGRPGQEAAGPLTKDDPDFRDVVRIRDRPYSGVPSLMTAEPLSTDCHDIAEKSRQALAGYRPPPPPATVRPPAIAYRALEQCISCHQSGGQQIAPFIPFDNELQLKPSLLANSQALYKDILERTQADARPGLRMPPQGGLAKEDREAIRSYVDSLMR